jgi:two-component system KDP operon response regulator KdpE
MSERDLIWVLEDDPGVQFVYREILGPSYDVVVASSLAELTKIVAETPKRARLLIADLRLPDGSFVDFIGKERHGLLSGLPYMVVSSVDDLATARQCFAQDAIDYLTKPFGRGEITIKIERFLAVARTRSLVNNVTLDAHTFRVEVGGVGSAVLTAREFQIIALLYHNKDLTATRTELLRKIWGAADLTGKTLDVHLHNLRRKLEPLALRIVYRRPHRYTLVYESTPEQ